MEKNKLHNLNLAVQWGLFLSVNSLFVCKYIPRIGFSPIICTIIYIVLFSCAFICYRRWIRPHITEHIARNISIILLVGIILTIGTAIFLISPLTLRVDRWSATSYFLDALFNGSYPYGVHTHASEFNFPSPFPLWHYLNIPFWLIGDVGWIQAFFIILFSCAVYLYFRSWRMLLSVLLLVCISPAYWWEIATRSDGLSNALLVCSCILYLQKKQIRMTDKWWLLAIFSGCIAATRLSAVIPLALYLFRPWIDTGWKQKIGFLILTISITFAFFAPYVFWDTHTWIFFHRNPFMSQTSPGNKWLLLLMVCIAILTAYKKQTFYYYISTTSVYMFAFMLVSHIGILWAFNFEINLFSIQCDISYFTLSLPYILLALNLPTNYSTPELVS